MLEGGSVGFEALSRGAKKSYFIEKNTIAIKTLEENISNIDSQNSILLKGDAFEIFESLYASLKTENTKTIFYFDPPFSIRDNMKDIYQRSINLISKIKDSLLLCYN